MKDEGRAYRAKLIYKLLSNKKAYVIFLVVMYVLGYLSASYSSRPVKIDSVGRGRSSRQATRASIPCQVEEFRVKTKCADVVTPPELVRQTILSRVFDGKSPYQDFPPAYVESLLRPKRLKGWGSYGDVFQHVIDRVRPRTIIEVGTFLGASALHMAELTRQRGLSTQILCLDDFRGWPGFREKLKGMNMVNGDVMLLYQFMQNVMNSNSTGSVLPMPFSTASSLEKLCEWGIQGDAIEIDAGHDFNSAWADINLAFRILRPGGIIFGHDYFTAKDNKGVRRAVTLFAELNGVKVKADGEHWVIDTGLES